MAQRQLQPHHRHRQLMRRTLLAGFMSLVAWLQGCAHASDSVGITLRFINEGPYSMGVHRFDPDGQRGPTPGALGVGGSKQMAFMAGDSKRGVPQFVEVEWAIATPEIQSLRARRNQSFSTYSKPWMDETDRINAITPHYTRRIDLTPILTPALLAQVRANRSTTRLILTVVFKDDNVTITAKPEVWR